MYIVVYAFISFNFPLLIVGKIRELNEAELPIPLTDRSACVLQGPDRWAGKAG